MGEAPCSLFPRGTPKEVAGRQKRRWAKRPSVASGSSPQHRLAHWKVEVGSFVPETWHIDETARALDGQRDVGVSCSTPCGPAAVGPVQRDITAHAVQARAPVGPPDPSSSPRPSATTLSHRRGNAGVAGSVPALAG